MDSSAIVMTLVALAAVVYVAILFMVLAMSQTSRFDRDRRQKAV